MGIVGEEMTSQYGQIAHVPPHLHSYSVILELEVPDFVAELPVAPVELIVGGHHQPVLFLKRRRRLLQKLLLQPDSLELHLDGPPSRAALRGEIGSAAVGRVGHTLRADVDAGGEHVPSGHIEVICSNKAMDGKYINMGKVTETKFSYSSRRPVASRWSS